MLALRSRPLWAFLLAVGLLRLVSLSVYPLMDTTEARYGEISRIIVETGNWIVPRIDYEIPFWGKPPLAFWASAASIEGFGNSEFFLRLPHFLAALLVLLLVWHFGVALKLTRRQADGAVAVLATTIGFLVTSGTVMTDMLLCLSMTLAMVGFWRGWHGEVGYVYLMYAGLGLGLLDKGPIILVLAALVVLPWIALQCGIRSMWKEIFSRLRVFRGLLLMMAIAAPWYFLMERASPGFLEYFFVGEHFHRFLDSGWRGDLYGSGHAHLRGTIWIYWFLCAFPWSLLFLISLYRTATGDRSLAFRDPQVSFLLLWMCSPMLLFTLAGNILPAYVVPGLPAIGLLVIKIYPANLIDRGRPLLLVGPLLLLVLSIELAVGVGDRYSDRELLAAIDPKLDLFYFEKRPYSAQYYSTGRARLVDTFPEQQRFYLVLDNDRELDAVDRYCELLNRNGDRRLFYCRRGPVS